MKKSRGQVLVAFLLLLPFLFLLITALLDFGFLAMQKQKIESVMDNALQYASENKKNDSLEEEVSDLVNKNITGITSLKTVKEEDYFEIEVTYKLKGIFNRFFKENEQYTKIKRKKYQ